MCENMLEVTTLLMRCRTRFDNSSGHVFMEALIFELTVANAWVGDIRPTKLIEAGGRVCNLAGEMWSGGQENGGNMYVLRNTRMRRLQGAQEYLNHGSPRWLYIHTCAL